MNTSIHRVKGVTITDEFWEGKHRDYTVKKISIDSCDCKLEIDLYSDGEGRIEVTQLPDEKCNL